MILNTAVELVPEGVTVEPYEISELPFFNSDLEADDPEVVLALKQAVSDADGVLFIAPEYNYGMTGVLKNAIDWANRGPKGTRGPRYSPMALKPVFIMSGSSQWSGGARAQVAVREAMVEPGALVYNFPQVLIGRFQDKIDDDGNLTDDLTRDYIALALDSFSTWVRLVGAKSANPFRDRLTELHTVDPRRIRGVR